MRAQDATWPDFGASSAERLLRKTWQAFVWMMMGADARTQAREISRLRFKATARRLVGSDPSATDGIFIGGIAFELGRSLDDGVCDCRIAGTMTSVPLCPETEQALAFLGDSLYEAGIIDFLNASIEAPPDDFADWGDWLRRHEIGPALRHLGELGYPQERLRALREQAEEVTPSARLRIRR